MTAYDSDDVQFPVFLITSDRRLRLMLAIMGEEMLIEIYISYTGGTGVYMSQMMV